jgi:hypothetical protein
MPRTMWKAVLAAKEAEKQGAIKQQRLAFKMTTGPREFTREGTLRAVVTLIATNNQVSPLELHPATSTHYAPVANCPR